MTNESRPRMMPVHSPILQVKQNLRDAETENANLRDLLNASMAENAALLQQVTEMQEALDGTQALWMASMVRCNELEFELVGDEEKRYALIERLRIAMGGYTDSDLVSLATTLNACAKQQDLLLAWSQAAYKRLGGLMAIGVSMTPDAVTAKLLNDAPANVAAEVDPFSTTVDSAYSIYADPLIVGVAEGLDCTVDELMEYAADSVGAPMDGAK